MIKRPMYKVETFLSENDLVIFKRHLFFFWKYCTRVSSLEEAKRKIDEGVGFYKQYPKKIVYKK